MIEVMVQSMSKQRPDGTFQIIGHRVNDPKEKPVTLLVNRPDAEELTKLAVKATKDDPLIIEVESKYLALVLAEKIA